MTVSQVVPVANETIFKEARLKVGLSVQSLPYSLTLPIVSVAVSLRIGVNTGYSYVRVNDNEAPVLGTGQVSPTTTATDAGWTLIYDDTADEDSIETDPFGFDFKLNNVSYNTCFITSNQYLTFASAALVYVNLGAAVPAVPKLHFGSNDLSYQRVYTKAEPGIFRIRWEGNSSYNASAGSSNRFAEIAFYGSLSSGKQLLEVRSGNITGTAGTFMLATASTSLASGTFAQNKSWVFEGNSAGTTWTLYADSHVE